MISHFVWEYKVNDPRRQAQLNRARATWNSVEYIKDSGPLRMSRFFEKAWMPGEIRVVTNADSCLVKEAYDWIEELGLEAVCSHRRNVNRIFKKQIDLDRLRQFEHFVGVDLIAITESWWTRVGSKLPDMLFGWEGWDWVWKIAIGCTTREDLVYHEYHGIPNWHSNRNHPCQLENRKLARAWVQDRRDKDMITLEWPLLRNDFKNFGR